MATMPVSFVGSDAWNADVYGTLAFASRLALVLKDRRFEYRLAFCFWRLNGHLDSLFNQVYSTMEKAQNGTLKVEQGASIDPEKVKTSVDQLENMHRILDSIYTVARRRLMPHSILKNGLDRLHRNDERVVELAGWLSDILQPQELERIFADALAEHERGETITLPG